MRRLDDDVGADGQLLVGGGIVVEDLARLAPGIPILPMVALTRNPPTGTTIVHVGDTESGHWVLIAPEEHLARPDEPLWVHTPDELVPLPAARPIFNQAAEMLMQQPTQTPELQTAAESAIIPPYRPTTLHPHRAVRSRAIAALGAGLRRAADAASTDWQSECARAIADATEFLANGARPAAARQTAELVSLALATGRPSLAKAALAGGQILNGAAEIAALESWSQGEAAPILEARPGNTIFAVTSAEIRSVARSLRSKAMGPSGLRAPILAAALTDATVREAMVRLIPRIVASPPAWLLRGRAVCVRKPAGGVRVIAVPEPLALLIERLILRRVRLPVSDLAFSGGGTATAVERIARAMAGDFVAVDFQTAYESIRADALLQATREWPG